jgi:hypothetical protein
MWFFKRKKQDPGKKRFSPPCPYCFSQDTRVSVSSSSENPDYIKVWRGQRSVNCRCLDCGKEFYADEPESGLSEEAVAGDDTVSDPDELRAAEEELERQIKDSDDRMCQ